MTTNDPIDPASQPPAAEPAAAQPPAAPAYTPPPAPPVAPAATPAGSSTLGLIAFLAAIVGAIVGAILAFVGGQQIGTIVQYADSRGQIDANALPESAIQAAASGGLLTTLAFVIWGLLALWGLIQGIIAIVKRRGRGWGIAAVIVAVLGVGVVGTFFGIGAAAGAAPYAAQISQLSSN